MIEQIIKSSQVIVLRGRYAYLKTKEKDLGVHFLISQDKDEITIVTEEANILKVKYQKIEKWFKLIEIRVSVPFLGVGFLAKITRAIADKKLNVLVVSTFSKDYLLVREETYKAAVKALEDIGFPVKIEMSEFPSFK